MTGTLEPLERVPFVTVALSAWIDDEPVGLGLLGGGALVLTGVYVGALRRSEESAAAEDPALLRE